MLLENISEPKQQFNVKLYCSMVKWIEAKAGEHNTTATNIVRHALNLYKRIDELNHDLLTSEAYYAKLRSEEIHPLIDCSNDENINEYVERNEYIDNEELKAGYALREKYADVIQYIPQLPESPMPF